MNKKKLDELAIINNIQAMFSDISTGNMEGISDDCAILPLNDRESLVVTTDVLTEGTHFIIDKITPFDLGYKALASNFSDVFSMGAKPICSFLSIALKKDINDEWVSNFMKGYHLLSSKESAPLLGGDTTFSIHATTISVTAIGKVLNKNIKRRKGASLGDIIAVCAPLGASGTGLNLLLDNSSLLYSPKEIELIKAHTHPPIYGVEACFLGGQIGVTSMIDISDGIAKDLRHVLKLSECGAKIFCDKIPISPLVKDVCKSKGWDATNLALSGGEEYAPLFTIAQNCYKQVKNAYKEKFNKEIYSIGVITNNINEIEWSLDGRVVKKNYKGYVHRR